MKKTLLTTALLASISSAYAADAPQWNQLSIGYVNGTLEQSGSSDIDLNGAAISGSILLNDSVFLAGRFESTSGDINISNRNVDVDVRRGEFGLGYRYGVTSTTDVYAKLSGIYYEVEASLGNISAKEDTNGGQLEAGIRSMITPNVELGASAAYIKYSDVDDGEDDNDKNLNIFAAYHFNDKWSAGLGYSKMDDVHFTELKGTYAF
ncbi:porin family protein [Marinomonas spartinae]|nr:porin family protein [Marinomonas spartinae]